MQRSLVPASSAYALWAHADGVPLLGDLRTSAVIGAAPTAGDTREVRRTDRGLRSDVTPRRVAPSGKPGCLSPPRHAKEYEREGIAPFGLRAGSLAHAAHTLSKVETVLFDWALRGHGAVTRRSVTFESAGHLFDSLELPRLGLTTQARHRARPTRPSTRTDCLARTDAGRSAWTASTTESPRPDVPRTS